MIARFSDRLSAWPQYLLPQHVLTALARRLSQCRASWFKNPFIAVFVRLFSVDLDESPRRRPQDFDSFDDFFTRALHPHARPLAPADHRMVCPCDGTVSRLGRIEGDTILQAKGFSYSAAALLGNHEHGRQFAGGGFITLYLAPGDYHRVHSPIAGEVIHETRIPGRLFSVSAATVRTIPHLFTRNERMAAMLDTDLGPVAVVMVAAMLVAGIETVWQPGQRLRPDARLTAHTIDRHELTRGGELGRFHWGSTVIVLTPPGSPAWHAKLAAGRRVRMGNPLTAAEH